MIKVFRTASFWRFPRALRTTSFWVFPEFVRLIFIAIAFVAVLMLAVSCRGEAASTTEKEPDIRLNGTHCIISESDQEPIVIDADSLELFTDDDTVVMRNARFFQNKKGSSEKNISGKAGYLKLNSRNQDVYLTDKVELFIYPDKEVPVSEDLTVDTDVSVGGNASADENAPVGKEAPDGEGMPDNAQESEADEALLGYAIEGDTEFDGEETELEANRILADEIVWGKYSKMLESPQNVLLEWEGTLIRGYGFKGNLNTGEFSFEKVEEGRL